MTHEMHGANAAPIDGVVVVTMVDTSPPASDFSKGLSGTITHCHVCLMVAVAKSEPSIISARVAVPGIERLSQESRPYRLSEDTPPPKYTI